MKNSRAREAKTAYANSFGLPEDKIEKLAALAKEWAASEDSRELTDAVARRYYEILEEEI